jgi:hypothetical protein
MFTWELDSPLALENRLAGLESAQTYQHIVDEILSGMRQQFDLAADAPLASVEQVRALFARYQGIGHPPQPLISEMVAGMREE